MAEEANPQSGVDSHDNPGGRRDDGLPSSFDVLIVGTGLVESIVSAAVSRNGHSVLHIDPREYYGGTWATFTLDQWTSASFMATPQEAVGNIEVAVNDSGGTMKWRNHVKSWEQNWYTESEDIENVLLKQKRRFNIDLMPKVIAAREDIVQLLITSNVSRYLEFLRISRLLTNLPPPDDNVIEPIPLSRSDIFTSKTLSLVEKRSLVKLIEAVMKSQKSTDEVTSQEELKEPSPETFEELILTTKVSNKIKHLVKSSITILEDGFSSKGEIFNQEFCTRCRLFLNSIGRYGNQTPFLWTLYGISEICQAFCRLSAVYGGIFILKRHLSEIKSVEDGFVVKTEQDDIKVKHIVIGPDLESDISGRERNRKEQASILLGRAVLITTGGNIKVPDENSKVKGDGIFLYRISGMEVIEMNHTSQAVPRDYRLVQISFPILNEEEQDWKCRKKVEETLSPFLTFEPSCNTNTTMTPVGGGDASNIQTDFNQATEASGAEEPEKPKVIYGSYFILGFTSSNISCELLVNNGENNVKNLILESTVASTDLTSYVAKAQKIFSAMYPEEEFLPKAPDCDDQEEMNGEEDEDNVHDEPSNDHETSSDVNQSLNNDAPTHTENETAGNAVVDS